MSLYMPPPSELEEGAIVWGYLRDSGGDAQEQSVPQQKEALQSYCQEHELALSHIFVDTAKTGKTVAGRDSFNDMIDLLTCSEMDMKPDGLLVWNMARFTRELDDANYYKAIIRRQGIVIHSLTDPIPEGVYGRVVEVIIDIANAEKVRQNSRDVKRALQTLVRQGFAHGGFPPRGYIAKPVTIGKKRNGEDRVVSRWVPDSELWKLVQLAWKLRSEGKSYSEIQEATEGQVYTSINGWPSFFANRTYLGVGKCGEIEIPDHHPAAVDQKTWDKVQQLHETNVIRCNGREDREKKRSPKTVIYQPLLSGIATCIECSAPMSFQNHTSSKGYIWQRYMCNQKIRNRVQCNGRAVNGKVANAAAVDMVMNRVLTVDGWEKCLQEIRQAPLDIAEIDRRIADQKEQLAEVQSMVENLMRFMEIYNGPGDCLMERLQMREAESRVIRSKLEELEQKRKAMLLEIDLGLLEITFDKWKDRFSKVLRENDEPDAVRRIVNNFTSGIEVGYSRLRLHSCYPVDLNKEVIVSPTNIRKTKYWFLTSITPVEIDLRASGKTSLKKMKEMLTEKPTRLPSERDRGIYRGYAQEKTPVKVLADQYQLSQTRIWAICAAVRRCQDVSV
jgi:DNA invertase Pin-like site-specific DNA recombinase